MKGETCKSCKALVLWALTKGGKRQPVDAAPASTGNLILEQRSGTLVSRVADLFDPPGDRYMPHHATCPDAEQWRRH